MDIIKEILDELADATEQELLDGLPVDPDDDWEDMDAYLDGLD